MRILSIVILVFGIILGASGYTWAYTWYPYNGHEYALLLEWHNFWEQEGRAVGEGAHLVTINDAGENQFLMNTFLNNDDIKGAMIGYYETAEGNWTWVGVTSSYTNWYGGCPNDSGHLSDASIYYPWGGTWYDAYIGHQGSAIMERSAAVPEPSSLLLLGSGLVGLVGLGRRKFIRWLKNLD